MPNLTRSGLDAAADLDSAVADLIATAPRAVLIGRSAGLSKWCAKHDVEYPPRDVLRAARSLLKVPPSSGA